MQIQESTQKDQLGNTSHSGLYECTQDGVTGKGATPHAAYINWLSKVNKQVS